LLNMKAIFMLAFMDELTHTEFITLLRRGHTSQARFARLTGYSVQHVNAWCQGRSPIPRWASLLAKALRKIPIWDIERLPIHFEWYETLGVQPFASKDVIRKAMAKLTKMHHPDHGGTLEVMQRVAAAYEKTKSMGIKP
jgi:DnaJ-domain-containing protein 1